MIRYHGHRHRLTCLLVGVQMVFTDQSMEKWCASSSKDAFKNVFPLPVSRLDDDTQRVYAFLTKQHLSELKPGDEDRFTAKSDSAVQVGGEVGR